MVAIDGIVSVRRFAPVADTGPYVAVYELEGDDLQQILKGMIAAARSGASRCRTCSSWIHHLRCGYSS